MILEYKLEYRSSSFVYERVFIATAHKLELHYDIARDGSTLLLYIHSQSVAELEEFATLFSSSLPHSIFLYDTQVQVIEELPEITPYTIPTDKIAMPFCPECASAVMDTSSKDYYNIFRSCSVCGYETQGESRNYRDEIQEIVMAIFQGRDISISTHYGYYRVGVPTKETREFDLLAYDQATIAKYATVEEYELQALGSIEKPLIRLKSTQKLTDDYSLGEQILRFKLADDILLYLLMEELHHIGIDLIYIANDSDQIQESYHLLEPQKILTPIEVVVSSSSVSIVSGNRSLPQSTKVDSLELTNLDIFHSIIAEHKPTDEHIAGIILNKKGRSAMLVHGEKYGTVGYLSLDFELGSIADIFKQIIETNESGGKIVQNYKKAYPEHFEKIIHIIFEDPRINIYTLWGIVAIVLELTDTTLLDEAAQTIERNIMLFEGSKGPRIDYKLYNIDGKVYLDPLMTIRTAMSFRLAGVDPLTISYGIVESFCEFIANEIDTVAQSMSTSAVIATGDILTNRRIYQKLNQEISNNHKLYFNNQIPLNRD